MQLNLAPELFVIGSGVGVNIVIILNLGHIGFGGVEYLVSVLAVVLIIYNRRVGGCIA